LYYRTFDLVLAAFETVMTFQVAYGASVVLGTVLLQTSPERGLSGGQMEAFLRAMKDVMHISPHSISKLKKVLLFTGRTPPPSPPPTRATYLAANALSRRYRILPTIAFIFPVTIQPMATIQKSHPIARSDYGITCPA
jgi:hypothetical protein